MEVANQISKGLAKKCVVAKVDGCVWDLLRPLEGDCALQLLSFEDAEGKEVRRNGTGRSRLSQGRLAGRDGSIWAAGQGRWPVACWVVRCWRRSLRLLLIITAHSRAAGVLACMLLEGAQLSSPSRHARSLTTAGPPACCPPSLALPARPCLHAQTFWHSSAHVLGQALELEFGADLTIGPALEEGFYYDCYLGDKTLSDAEKARLTKRMQQVRAGLRAGGARRHGGRGGRAGCGCVS